MPKVDYYKILGIERTASAEDIKKAYYYLVKKYHPDKNPQSMDKYLLVCEAYKILGNLDNRLEYAISLYEEVWNDFEINNKELKQIFKQNDEKKSKRNGY